MPQHPFQSHPPGPGRHVSLEGTSKREGKKPIPPHGDTQAFGAGGFLGTQVAVPRLPGFSQVPNYSVSDERCDLAYDDTASPLYETANAPHITPQGGFEHCATSSPPRGYHDDLNYSSSNPAYPFQDTIDANAPLISNNMPRSDVTWSGIDTTVTPCPGAPSICQFCCSICFSRCSAASAARLQLQQHRYEEQLKQAARQKQTDMLDAFQESVRVEMDQITGRLDAAEWPEATDDSSPTGQEKVKRKQEPAAKKAAKKRRNTFQNNVSLARTERMQRAMGNQGQPSPSRNRNSTGRTWTRESIVKTSEDIHFKYHKLCVNFRAIAQKVEEFDPELARQMQEDSEAAIAAFREMKTKEEMDLQKEARRCRGVAISSDIGGHVFRG